MASAKELLFLSTENQGNLPYRSRKIAFSPDGQLIASTSNDSDNVTLWEFPSGRKLRVLPAGDYPPGGHSLAFSPDGKKLASGALSGRIRLWDMSTGLLLLDIDGRNSDTNVDVPVYGLMFSPDGKRLVSNSIVAAMVWDAESGHKLSTISGPAILMSNLAFSPNGLKLAAATLDTITLWDLTNDLRMQTISGHRGKINDMAFSSDGELLASGSNDSTIKLWDMDTLHLRKTLVSFDPVIDIAFSPNGKLLASGTGSEVRLWDISTDYLSKTLPNLAGSYVAFSSDGQYLATGAIGSKILAIWELPGRRRVFDIGTLEESIDDLFFSKDDKSLFIVAHEFADFRYAKPSSSFGSLFTGKITNLGHLQIVKGVEGVSAAAPASDGNLLVAGHVDGSMSLLDMQSLRKILTIHGHKGTVYNIVISPDGKLVATSSDDGTVRLWGIP